MLENKQCIYCHQPFQANKYSPRQKVCSRPECQHARQIESMRQWRERNPNYFKYDESKGQDWLNAQRERSRLWRQRNPDKIKQYRQTHLEVYREYMRDYMRRYRQKRKESGRPASGGRPPLQTPPDNAPDTGPSV